MISNIVRNTLSRYITGEKEIVFRNKIPAFSTLEEKFRELNEFGLYLHIPFCNQICPYCPYNKEIFREEPSVRYINAVIKEIDIYSSITGNKPVSSFYIGGGTPTTILHKGIDRIIDRIYNRFNMQCNIHMESHPNHLSAENLAYMESMGIDYLSVGVEALQDHHLKAIKRPYTVAEVRKAVERAVSRNFKCVNIDFIFDLPNQSKKEIEDAGYDMVRLGVDQVAAYPLFKFPYTNLGREFHKNRNQLITMLRRRNYLRILERIFYDSGFYRSSVWAFTRKGVCKYCSVTVPLYLGLGASGSSYLKDTFFVNTFNVEEYITAIETDKSPIALSIDLSNQMQMAGWLYWRIYETRFRKSDFFNRFNTDFNRQYGKFIRLMNLFGFIKNHQDLISFTDRGTYWTHAFEDFFSINYISKLWGTSKQNPWPEQVTL